MSVQHGRHGFPRVLDGEVTYAQLCSSCPSAPGVELPGNKHSLRNDDRDPKNHVKQASEVLRQDQKTEAVQGHQYSSPGG